MQNSRIYNELRRRERARLWRDIITGLRDFVGVVAVAILLSAALIIAYLLDANTLAV